MRAKSSGSHPSLLGLWSGTVAAVLLITVAPGVRQQASAQEWSPPTRVYVEQAGHTVDGLFLDFWRSYPELLGQPITEEFTQRGLQPTGPATPAPADDAAEIIVQYFENGAIAYLPDEDPGEQVEMLPVGQEAVNYVDRKHRDALKPATSCDGLDAETCVVVAETDHTIRHGFKRFWEAHGGGRLLGHPISEEFVAKDRDTVQYFENGVLQWNEASDVSVRSAGVEVAKRLKLEVKKIDRPENIPVYDESLFVPPAIVVEPELEVESVGAVRASGPGPQQGGYKEIVISIGQQTMWAYEDGALVTSSLVSTGTAEIPEVTTPLGFYSVLTKYDVQTMEGTISNEHYRVEDVPDVMYFDNLGNALHGAYWHNNFGTPMSHGCVNLPLDIAAFLYDWAPIGTAVSVIA